MVSSKMTALNFILVACVSLVVSPLGLGRTETAEAPCQQPPVYNDVDTVTINSCCNKTDEDDEIKRELQEVKELLNRVLANSAGCCDQTTSVPGQTTSVPQVLRNCYDIQQNGRTTSGIYTIQPNGSRPFSVYCDMDTDGGGWTVFQRRMDGSVDFYLDWADYEDGFGSLTGEHWLGNKNLYYLTNQQTTRLRVDLADFENETRYAEYEYFVIADGSNNYQLDVGDYSGDAGDAMAEQNGQYFTARDKDNDEYADGECTELFKGAWWYRSCHHANPNGLYLGGPHSSYADGIEWYEWKGYYYSLKFIEMKLRPELN